MPLPAQNSITKSTEAQHFIQLTNFTDRVNVIYFESLFSGTAVAVPCSISAHLQFTF
jgi:hypothetical protein